MLPQWSVHEAKSYLERSGWKVNTLSGHSLLWSYQEVGSFLVLKCGPEHALCIPAEGAVPFEEVSKVLLYRFPVAITSGFPTLWKELNAFYGRHMPSTEYEALTLLAHGRLSPTLQALCRAQLPESLPEPLNRVYRDWEVQHAVYTR